MSYPRGEHEIYKDLSPGGDGRHLRCLLAGPDRVAFIDMRRTPLPPEWITRAKADAMAASRELVRVDAGPFDPAPSRETERGAMNEAERKRHDARIEERDRWRKVLELLVAVPREAYLDPALRHAAVAEAAAKHGVRADKINYWCRRYYQAGRSLSGLMRDYRGCGRGRTRDASGMALLGRPRRNFGEREGRKSGLNATPEVAGHFKWAANRYQKGMRTWEQCFEDMLDRFYREKVTGPDGRAMFVSRDVPLPTLHQFYAHVRRKIGLTEITRKLVGPTAYEMYHAPRTSTSAGLALGPGDHYALDATLVDQYVLSQDGSEVVGRPVLYLVIDYYSHMIVGFYLGLENPSWTPASLALANAISAKREYCRSLSVDIGPGEWPAEHCPRTVSVDRGSDVVGLDMGTALFALDVAHIVCPPARPDRKALVENAMHLVEIELTNPNARALHPRSMDDTPVPGDATLTLREMEQKFVHWIRKYNAALRIKRAQWPSGFVGKGKASALQLWEYGCLNARAPQRKGALEVALALLRHDTVTASKKGFHLERELYYETDDPQVQILLHRRQGQVSARLTFLRDDRTLDWGVIVFGERLIPARLCHCSKSSKHLSMFEFDWRYKQDKVAEAEQAVGNRAREQRLRNDNAEIDAAAAERRRENGPPVSRPGGMPAARRAEMGRIHKAAVLFAEEPVPASGSAAPAGSGAAWRAIYPPNFLESDDD